MNQQPSPAGDHAHSDNPLPYPNPNPSDSHTSDYAPYPTLDPNDVAPPPDPLLAQRSDPSPPSVATTMPQEHNPYVSAVPRPTSSTKNAMDTVKELLGKWGKQANEAANKAQDLAGNMWQHLKTSPNMAEAAVTRISHQTKVIAEGGYEKVFCQTFESLPDEQLRKWYACYLSTSAGPVMGTLYLSTAKLAFCSDNPLSYKNGEQTTWSYYKVVILLDQLKAVNPSTSKVNPLEKYIQIITIDNHEFWFMGFVNYDSAVKNLLEIHTSN